jgi:hypothetical protein
MSFSVPVSHYSARVERCTHALELLHVALPTERSHLERGLENGGASTHAGVEEPWRDCVDARKALPLHSKALAEVDDGCMRVRYSLRSGDGAGVDVQEMAQGKRVEVGTSRRGLAAWT